MKFSEEIKNIPEEELNQRRSKYGAPQDSEKRSIEIELERRKKNANEEKFNKTLNVAENNVKSSKNLAHLRCGLLITDIFHLFITFRASKRWIYAFLTAL